MSENTTGKQGTPKHLWVVGIFALLWSAMGAYDYLMTETQNEAYMSSFTPEQLDFFYGLPAWAVSAWTLARHLGRHLPVRPGTLPLRPGHATARPLRLGRVGRVGRRVPTSLNARLRVTAQLRQP
jgi:hypothetical protein